MTKIYVPDLKPLVPPKSRMYMPLADYVDSRSGSGASVEVHGSSLDEIVINGKAVQDGTPTPSAPVPIEVVCGRNLIPAFTLSKTNQGVTFSYNADNTVGFSGGTNSSSAGVVSVSDLFNAGGGVTLPAGTYTASSVPTYVATRADDNIASARVQVYDSNSTLLGSSGYVASGNISSVTFTLDSEKSVCVRFSVRTNTTSISGTASLQLEVGSTATPHSPHGSIGLKVGDTVTPIDLQGNVLASLPDGTRDTLTVDSAGHCVLTKRVGHYTVTGNETIASTAQYTTYRRIVTDALSGRKGVTNSQQSGICDYAPFTTSTTNDSLHVAVTITSLILFAIAEDAAGVLSQYIGANVFYKLSTPQEIDLGYIDMPGIPSGGAAVSMLAIVTPEIEVGYTVKGSDILADLLSVSEQ